MVGKNGSQLVQVGYRVHLHRALLQAKPAIEVGADADMVPGGELGDVLGVVPERLERYGKASVVPPAGLEEAVIEHQTDHAFSRCDGADDLVGEVPVGWGERPCVRVRSTDLRDTEI
jgi:hypothetical protein